VSYLKIALALALMGFGATAVISYRHLATKAATADARIAAAEQRADTQAKALSLLSQEMVSRAEFDAAIRNTRLQIQKSLDHAEATDPAARAYLHERIPDSVRHAATAPVR
jgi:hypothetical protein